MCVCVKALYPWCGQPEDEPCGALSWRAPGDQGVQEGQQVLEDQEGQVVLSGRRGQCLNSMVVKKVLRESKSQNSIAGLD